MPNWWTIPSIYRVGPIVCLQPTSLLLQCDTTFIKGVTIVRIVTIVTIVRIVRIVSIVRIVRIVAIVRIVTIVRIVAIVKIVTCPMCEQSILLFAIQLNYSGSACLDIENKVCAFVGFGD